MTDPSIPGARVRPGAFYRSNPYHRFLYRGVLALLAAGILLCVRAAAARQAAHSRAVRPAIGAAARAFPLTVDGIHIFADQLPTQVTPAQLGFIAGHYAGSQKMPEAWTRRIRQLNPNFLMLHYQLAVGAGPAAFMDGDRWTNDFNRVTRHEDWFMHDMQGRRLLQPAWDWYLMDIRFDGDRPRTGFPAYWLQTAVQRMRDNDADGCFADSYTQDILMGQLKPPTPLFSNAADNARDWLPHLNRYGAYCASGFHRQPERFYYLPNLGGLVTTWDHYTNYAVGDGGMNEGFCAGGPGNYYSDSDWKLQMTRVLDLAARGKILLEQTGTDPANLDHRWFIVGSYLLTKGPHSYLNMIHRSSLEWYPEYTLPLGEYLAPPSPDVDDYWDKKWGVYRRDYQHGMVLVNDQPGPVAVPALGATYFEAVSHGGGPVPDSGQSPGTLSYRAVNAITVPGHSARVLLKAAPVQ